MKVIFSQGFYFLVYNALKATEIELTFQRNLSPPSLGLKRRPSRKLLLAMLLLALFFDLEYGGDMFLRNIGVNIGPMVRI
jgi:hypothetical protein